MSDWERISAPDLERLSAYLDGELEPSQASQLEARLRQDAALRQALRELERTVEAVRWLPAAAAPRDFRLTEQMVAESRGGLLARLEAGLRNLRLYPLLQLGTALAALALVTLAGFDVLVNNTLAGIRLESSPLAAEQAFQAPQAAEDLDQPLGLAEEQAVQTAEAEQALRAEELRAEPAEAPAEEAEAAASGQAVGETPTPSEEQLSAADELEASEMQDEQEEADLAAAPAPEAGEPMPPEPVSPAAPLAERAEAAERFRTPAARTALTVAELGLAAATLLLLLFTLRERHRA